MNKTKTCDLLLNAVKEEGKFYSLIEALRPEDLVPVQRFFWDYTMDYSHQRGKPLMREDITRRMEDTTHYQLRVGCFEPVDSCRANICVMSNPNCAGEKLKACLRLLREIIHELGNNQ